jgi:hypothetical protein
MGTNDQIQTVLHGKALLSSVHRTEIRPAPFVFQWRALQHELAFKNARLDCFFAENFEIAAAPNRVARESGNVPQFAKTLLSHLIVS